MTSPSPHPTVPDARRLDDNAAVPSGGAGSTPDAAAAAATAAPAPSSVVVLLDKLLSTAGPCAGRPSTLEDCSVPPQAGFRAADAYATLTPALLVDERL